MNEKISFPSGTTQKIHFNMKNSVGISGTTIRCYIAKFNDKNAITTIEASDIRASGNVITVTIQPSKTINFNGMYHLQLEIVGVTETLRSDCLPFMVEKSIA